MKYQKPKLIFKSKPENALVGINNVNSANVTFTMIAEFEHDTVDHDQNGTTHIHIEEFIIKLFREESGVPKLLKTYKNKFAFPTVIGGKSNFVMNPEIPLKDLKLNARNRKYWATISARGTIDPNNILELAVTPKETLFTVGGNTSIG